MKRNVAKHIRKSVKPMTMTQFERSPMDRRMDKKMGYKEGSPRDNAADRAALAKINANRAKRG